MAQAVLDQSRDLSGRETHRLTSIYAPPDFVKQAAGERLHGDAETMPRHLYAEPHQKLYPCHTAAATWLSQLFFLHKQAELEPRLQQVVGDNLDHAAAFFGIRSFTDGLKEAVAKNANNPEAALPDDVFAIIWQGENGVKERHWPLRNAKEVKFAAVHYAKHRDDFVFADRHQIASKISEKADEYGASLGEHRVMIDKAAADGVCAASTAAAVIEKRAKLTQRSHPEISAELTKLAQIVRDCPAQARGREQLVKLASILDAADRETHLSRIYEDGGLGRPEDELFLITVKTAADFTAAHVPTTTGRLYEKTALEQLSVQQVRDWMGNAFADETSAGGIYVDGEKMAVLLPTLDRGAANMFDRMMEAASLAPIAVEKAASDAPLSRQNLLAIAAGLPG